MREKIFDNRPRVRNGYCVLPFARLTSLALLLASLALSVRPSHAGEAEIGEVLRATNAHFGGSSEKVGTAEPLHAGDKLVIEPGGMVTLCFYKTGLRYRLTVPAGTPAATAVIPANGREDLAPHAKNLHCEAMSTIVATVVQNLGPDGRQKFDPRTASSGMRTIERTKDGIIRLPAVDDALADVEAPAEFQFDEPLQAGRAYTVSLTAADTSVEGNRVWQADLTSDTPSATIPAGTLKPGKRYRWKVDRKTGYLWTLTKKGDTELQTALKTANASAQAAPTDPDTLLIVADIFNTYGLETLAADTYQNALDRHPSDPSLSSLVPKIQRTISVRPVEGTGK